MSKKLSLISILIIGVFCIGLKADAVCKSSTYDCVNAKKGDPCECPCLSKTVPGSCNDSGVCIGIKDCPGCGNGQIDSGEECESNSDCGSTEICKECQCEEIEDNCTDKECYGTRQGQKGCDDGYYCEVKSELGETPQQCGCAPCSQFMCGKGENNEENNCFPNSCIINTSGGCHCSTCTNEDCNGVACKDGETCATPFSSKISPTLPCECISCTDTNCGGTTDSPGKNCKSMGQSCKETQDDDSWPLCTCKGGGPSPQCEEDEDCNDDEPCTEDICLGGVCAHPIDGKCECKDKNCDDSDECTEDYCDESTGECVHDIISGCGYDDNTGMPCEKDLECDDNDPCTDDSCNILTKTCKHQLTSIRCGCPQGQRRCPGSHVGDPCCKSCCNSPHNLCAEYPTCTNQCYLNTIKFCTSSFNSIDYLNLK